MKLFGKYIEQGNDPLLNGVEESAKQNPFSTPEGYFDKLSSDILSKINSTPISPVSKFNPFSIAAIIVGTLMVATAVYYFSTSNSESSTNEKPVTIEKEKIQSMPRVILSDDSELPVSIVRNSELSNSTVVVINSEVEKQVVFAAIDELPLDSNVRSFVATEYERQMLALIAEANVENVTVLNIPEKLDIQLNTDKNKQNAEHSTETQRSAFALLPKDTCSETGIVLSAFIPNAVKYLWSNGETSSDISVSETGIYKVSVTLADNSVQQKSISARIIPRPDLSSDYLVTGCQGASLRLTVEQKEKGYKYYWPQYNLKAPQMTVSRPGLYYATISGCKMYADSFFVVFSHCELGIPNVISPNGDGINETFTIKNLDYYPNTELYIYDRTNKLIFKSENYKNDWDASSTPNGSYYFLLRFTDGSTQEGLLNVQPK